MGKTSKKASVPEEVVVEASPVMGENEQTQAELLDESRREAQANHAKDHADDEAVVAWLIHGWRRY